MVYHSKQEVIHKSRIDKEYILLFCTILPEFSDRRYCSRQTHFQEYEQFFLQE